MECYDEQKEYIEKARLALDSAEVALLRLELAYRASHPPTDEEIAEAQVQRKRLLITRYAKLAETLGDEFKLGPLDEKLESDLVGCDRHPFPYLGKGVISRHHAHPIDEATHRVSIESPKNSIMPLRREFIRLDCPKITSR